MKRAQRKLEHIKYALETGFGPASTHFEDIRFLHKCLPELNPADISLSAELFGKELSVPLLVDAITGGTDAVTEINKNIAVLCDALGIAMAVGSQYGAVRTGTGYESYEVIRKYNPHGIVFANISALATPQQAQAAVNMLDADALEIHLNAAQELIMPEGDKEFSGLFDNLLRIRDYVNVPVIIKETGCGIAAEEYLKLQKEGFTFFDCAGAGGTNFPAIEAKRAEESLAPLMAGWGVPTCWSIIDAAVCLEEEHFLIASGGIDSVEKVLKAYALGADMVGMAGIVLRFIVKNDLDGACRFFDNLIHDLKRYLLLLGCKNIKALRTSPLVYTGETVNFIQCRDYELSKISKIRR